MKTSDIAIVLFLGILLAAGAYSYLTSGANFCNFRENCLYCNPVTSNCVSTQMVMLRECTTATVKMDSPDQRMMIVSKKVGSNCVYDFSITNLDLVPAASGTTMSCLVPEDKVEFAFANSMNNILQFCMGPAKDALGATGSYNVTE